MTQTSTLDRLAAPMPVSGKLGVITLWSVWLTAPASVLDAYTGIKGVWLPFFFVLFGAAIYTARAVNTSSGKRSPEPFVRGVGRAAPFIVLAIVALGFVMQLSTSTPFYTVVAGLVATAFCAAISPVIAATVARSGTGQD